MQQVKDMVAKMTPLFLASLTSGATFETEGLMLGIADEPLVWTLKSANARAGQYSFDVSYFGIRLGHFAVLVNGTEVHAEEL